MGAAGKRRSFGCRSLGQALKFAQACFLCQQAGEKAVKAVWFYRGEDPWGHSILRLIEDIEDEDLRRNLEQFKDQAMVLDRLYVPTRYPNGLPDLAPMEAFGMTDFRAAYEGANALIGFAQSCLR